MKIFTLLLKMLEPCIVTSWPLTFKRAIFKWKSEQDVGPCWPRRTAKDSFVPILIRIVLRPDALTDIFTNTSLDQREELQKPRDRQNFHFHPLRKRTCPVYFRPQKELFKLFQHFWTWIFWIWTFALNLLGHWKCSNVSLLQKSWVIYLFAVKNVSINV